MAMYIFQELAPKIFYFTYSLQEPDLYVKFLEESETDSSNKNIIKPWQQMNGDKQEVHYGYDKIISSDFTKEDDIDGRSLYIVNTLKATMLHCFGQYKIYNNIEDDINIGKTFWVKKYNERYSHTEVGSGKYTAYFYLNDNYDGGNISFSNTRAFVKPEKGSIIIAPSDQEHISSPSLNGTRYVAQGYWL